MEANPQFSHVEHPVVGLQFGRQRAEFGDDCELVVGVRHPLLKKPIRLPCIGSRGITARDDLLRSELGGKFKAGVNRRNQEAAELIDVDLA